MYFSLAMGNATLDYFLIFYEISELPSKWHVSVVLIRSNLQPMKLQSEYSTKA